MTPADLEIVVSRTGHARFRWLTSDANPDVRSREGYRRLVARLARDEQPWPGPAPDAPKPVPLAASLQARKLGVRNCFYASKPACSCQGSAKCWRLGKNVTLRDCLDCLKP